MNERQARFLALGDSYTAAEGVPLAQSWPCHLVAMLRAEGFPVGDPKVVAKTGWTTGELARAIDEASLHPGPYDLVSLLVGVNDQYRGGDAASYRRDFASLLDRAVGFAGGDPRRVLVLSIPDWGLTPFARERDHAAIGREIDAFNAVNREEALRAGARYVDVTTASRAPGASLAPDGLHPGGGQYAEWARMALAEAREILRT